MSNGFSTTLLICAGNEANDVALRMGEAVTGYHGVIATNRERWGQVYALRICAARETGM